MAYDYRYIIDAYAWIEYFKASKPGEAARKYIESNQSATPTIVIAELSRKLSKEIELGNETPTGREGRLEFIRATTQIIDLDFTTATTAGELDLEMKKKKPGWGLADSIILTTAKTAEAKVITGDKHFENLKEAILI